MYIKKIIGHICEAKLSAIFLSCALLIQTIYLHIIYTKKKKEKKKKTIFSIK